MRRSLALLAALALLPLTSARGSEPAETPAESAPQGVLTKMPVLRHFVEAPYPPDAEAQRIEGAVLLEIDIGADGKVSRAVVVEPAGHRFDESAVEAVQQFEFEPAEIDHQPAPVRLTYRYEFVLRPPTPAPQEAAEAGPGVVVFDGRVLEKGTRMPQRGATVYATRGERTAEAVCDEEGRFQFVDLAPGEWKVVIAIAGFDRYETREEIVDGEVTSATYYVRRRAGAFEATVRGRREKKDVSRRTISIVEAKVVPGTFGDAVRVVQNLPGVARTPAGLGPLMVRGGRPGDTRTYVDGQLVPILFHFGGLTSVVNGDFLESIDFYPGNFPVKYGRSIAGAVDVNTRPGNRERYRGYFNVSVAEASLFAEGPLLDNGAFMASVRHSYLHFVLPTVLPLFLSKKQLDLTVVPTYGDYQLKTDWTFGKNQLEFFLYGSGDELSLLLNDPSQASTTGQGDFQSSIGFHRLTGRWARPLVEGLRHELSATLGTGHTAATLGKAVYGRLRLDTLAVREDLTWTLSDQLTLGAGLDFYSVRFNYAVQGPLPPRPGEFFNPSLGDDFAAVTEQGFAFQPAAYLDAIWKPVPSLKLVPGVRYDFDTFIRRGWVDPRLAAFWDVADGLTIKASAGLYHQPPTPEKLLPRFGNPDLIEEGSAQYAAGVEWRFLGQYSVDLQVYYKDLFQQANRGHELTSDQAEEVLDGHVFASNGQGRAYGAELLLRREPGADGFFGWIALSVGQAERRQSPDQPWNQAALNQRYNLVGVLSYRGPWDLTFGTRMRLTDGNPTTLYQTAIYDSDADLYLPVPSFQRRTSRRPAFFQWDVRVDRRFVFDQWTLEAYVDVQNVTNHPNEEGTNWNFDYSRSVPTTGLPIFPVIGIKGEL